eukprot:3012073-Karenia_brevis.AAC.1
MQLAMVSSDLQSATPGPLCLLKISCTSSKLASPAQYQQPVSLAETPHMFPAVLQPAAVIML